MRKWLEYFFEEMEFPAEAKEALLKDYEAISVCPGFAYPLYLYENDQPVAHQRMQKWLSNVSPAYGVHPYAALFLLYCCMARHLKEKYEARGLSMEIWKDSMKDSRCKLMECHNMYGIWGSFVTFWIPRFFEMTCFGLGRLEFEVIPSPIASPEMKKGEPVINVHIPSRGPLYENEVDDAFAKAKMFFASQVPKGIIVCHSWLLNPDYPRFLGDKSRVLAFMKRFTIESVEEEPGFGDCWRLFNVEYDGHPENLPRSTTVQRACADWLMGGHVAKSGIGWLKVE